MDASLKPDTVEVDLDLAKAFINQNEKLWTRDAQTSADEDLTVIQVKRTCIEPQVLLREKFLELADLIRENAKLFSQLEYMRRGIHPEEVISKDIKLLVQNLLYISMTPKANSPVYSIFCVMPKELQWLRDPVEITDKVPLAHLGFVSQKHHRQFPAQIIASVTSAAVCTLFAQLCEKVGLHIELKISEKPLENTVKVPEGCSGVVAERSDLDSAVDALLGSTTEYPWKLTRILVQESIYERFQKVLEYKCKGGDCDSSRSRTCSKAFYYGNKAFLLDFSGENDQINEKISGETSDKISTNYVIVEAYRTTKELLSMMQKYGSPYISLWCSDISEANEIASSAHSRAIWINGYALFNGPAVSSQVYYGILKPTIKTDFENINSPTIKTDFENIISLTDKWSKLSQDARDKTLRKCIKIFAEKENDETSMIFLDDIHKLMFSNNHQIAGIEKGSSSMCVVERRLVGISVVKVACSDKNVLPQISESISALRHGSGISYDYADHLRPINEVAARVEKLFKIMNAENVPVEDNYAFSEYQPDVDYYEIKAVWTTFGTIFAN